LEPGINFGNQWVTTNPSTLGWAKNHNKYISLCTSPWRLELWFAR